MPGILPMKVIKVGTSSQSRIAQACDRCRSKKIRCDGIRPTCSQCTSVGFECKTSDKLSRRAFPRGYTESLEERVRQLETEVRELKDLLDEKDEKLEMLSKMHSNRSPSVGSNQSVRSAGAKSVKALPAREDVFRVQASPLLLGVENSDSYFMGASSGRAFIETFKRKLQENGKSCSDFNPEAFLHIQGCYPLAARAPSQALRVPPRLFSDRCVNVYFQEWAPLFPVLHKPTFLSLYEEFVADSDKVKNNHKLAQLYLVFSIASLSGGQPDTEQLAACELQWQKALNAIIMDNTMNTLQCLVLALIYCTIRADYKRLQHYKGVAVGLSHRLGLHQSQKRFSFGALTMETRKKVFWTLYTLDCFSAAMLGLPKLLKEDDVQAEYPSDTDDEYVTEKGFQPTLPGDYTRLSSALALFRLSRILGTILEKSYPAATSHEISLQDISALDAQLSEWSENLPDHLRLNFVQDKPSTDVTGSRSPILAMAYYYTRTLVHRPAVGSSLGSKAASSVLAIGECSKHMVQIIQLLEERGMSFSFCLNKTDVLVLCGMALLYQCLDLKHESKLMKDAERLVNAVLKIMQRESASGCYDLKRVAMMLIRVDEPPPQPQQQQQARRARGDQDNTTMAAPPPPMASPTTTANFMKKKALFSIGRNAGASVSENDLLAQQEKLRRISMPAPRPNNHNNGPPPELYQPPHPPPARVTFDNASSASGSGSASDRTATATPRNHHHHRFSISHLQQTMMRMSPTHNKVKPQQQQQQPNLDYLSLSSSNNAPPSAASPQQQQQQPSSSPAQARMPPSSSSSQQQPMPHQHQPQPPPQQQAAPPPPPVYSSKGGGGGSGGGVSLSEWEALLGAMDGGQMNVYDAIYGGGPGGGGGGGAMAGMTTDNTPTSTTGTTHFGEWSPDSWDLSSINIGSSGDQLSVAHQPAGAQSVLSLSDESSLSSAEDRTSSELYHLNGIGGGEDYANGGGGGGGLMRQQHARSSHDGSGAGALHHRHYHHQRQQPQQHQQHHDHYHHHPEGSMGMGAVHHSMGLRYVAPHGLSSAEDYI
ncbi:fungal-specific transcription factor domain-containing protein [Xylariaceae sp. FL0804]|nr:fungal-specific transcription factor domain-containing protein [Xylariaceae sp. FL0804]